jgi:transposase, IS5 family
LFQKLNYWLNKQGKILKEGSIIDGTIVDVPIQRNSKEENEQIKNGETPE